MPPAADDLEPLARRPWDVVVVGAGPAGSLAAHGCASRGLRVLLVEQRRFPRWKVCGACLSPQAQAALAAAGLEHLVEEQGGLPLRQLQLGVAGRVSPIALARGQALSRARFDQALLEEAESAGVTVLAGTRAALGASEAGVREVVLRQGAGRQSVRARVVLIAAGLAHRCLDDEPGLHTQIESGSRVGAGCVLPAEAAAVPPGVLQMAVGRGGYLGLVRVESGEINLACALDRDQLRASGGAGPACQQLLTEAGFPPLPELPEGSWQLTPPLSRRTRPLAGHRLLLLGDAAGYVEPFTGEGMGWALTSALAALPLVSRGLEHWDGVIEADWRRRHQQWVERRQGFCRGLALLLRHPWATRSLHRSAAGLPALTSSLIEVLQRPSLPTPIH
ncbi:FAD-dependent oxidoreductase [Synechococcus sp. BSF8S]|uniref:NAD(P)/FAD-dependent oxidoreductase n=1 Tax=Synechococcales TaxID=1890424 RepID=UPI0016253B65|nr:MULTISPECIES: FAD-dependent monooxygenase [unclassified Synechococcus]MBC1261165.1 FAD-dependent oxidoreductase [Synechococcus sp. BSF8S]MBC1264068.1 FAD-dependent oxidoreductase [Synechococcus sp. BSA11S]